MHKMTYTQFKAIYEAVGGRLRAVNQGAFKKVYMPDEAVFCLIELGSSDETDFLAHSMYGEINKTVSDDSGRPLYRLAMTEKGWKFLSHMTTIITATETNSVSMKTFKNEDRCIYTVKHLKADGSLVTDYVADQANIVETRVTIKPTYDFDILKGTIYNKAYATDICNIGVGIGNFSGTKEDITNVGVDLYSEFIGGLDLEEFQGVIHIDGESSKMINKDIGVGADMNMIQIRVHHAAGLQHKFMCSLEYYRA